MADFVHFASEGLALYLWTKMAGPGGDPWSIGRERASRGTGGFSYRNTIVVEQDGQVVAGLIGYALPDHSEPIDDAMPAMFVPLQELENLAPGTWYVNVLAAYPEHRGRGYGGALLAVADRLAADRGEPRPVHHRCRYQHRRPQTLRALWLPGSGQTQDGQGRLAASRRRLGAADQSRSEPSDRSNFHRTIRQ